jgi:large subunit ribosomal protein L6
MSRIGRAPIAVPAGVQVDVDARQVRVKGPKGQIAWDIHPTVAVALDAGSLRVTPRSEERLAKAMHGTSRQILGNMVRGVTQGFRKTLDIVGVGYNAKVQGKKLVLQIGFCHPVEVPIPEGIALELPTNVRIHVNGVDKQLVGQFAANIRGLRPPEPYKGKGIRYEGEQLRRKAAKAAGA